MRVLDDLTNAAVCATLNEYYAGTMYSLPPWSRSYYTVNGFYFASFIDTTDPKVGRVLMSHFALFDSSLRLKAILSPK